ncbi:inositol monophosphatase (extragenic suppressor protein) [Saccharopolyspora erythraea NRRL 2338]|uniref:inositol-phosphate phosphatase n=1 Tax=Saccharopolyspora erythraea (strain ATCC 11635 / DSM 40517 / JCM 4748 / NBRC 13426 / NCIMB 8594 / NRRL 2338) TaxID=405948 RepID=A4FPU5_SACEN|nr:inositol monophosphatase (extragenic suppressor protein) [Saccharopolyspora erythraea NRRL 2338]
MPSEPAQRVEPGLVSRALEIAGRLANDAADVITDTAGRGARPAATESPFDWVTDTGRILERHTRRVLADEFPGIPVFGEEFDSSPGTTVAEQWAARSSSARFRWSVDPVDGTANYVAGLPWCAYSLAMLDEHGPVVGVVADPYRGQIYAAARGRGMRANGTPVRLSDQQETRAGIVCTELTRTGAWCGMDRFITNATAAQVGVRLLGSPALAIAQVALGHAMAAVLDSYEEWDVAGALALAAESGAAVLDRQGRHTALPSDGLLVAAPGVADNVLHWWSQSTGDRTSESTG